MSTSIKLAIVLQGMGRSSHIKYGDFLRIPVPGREEPVHCYGGRFYAMPEEAAQFEADMLKAGMRMRDGVRPATVVVIQEAMADAEPLAKIEQSEPVMPNPMLLNPLEPVRTDEVATPPAPPAPVTHGVLEPEAPAAKPKKASTKKKKAA